LVTHIFELRLEGRIISEPDLKWVDRPRWA